MYIASLEQDRSPFLRSDQGGEEVGGGRSRMGRLLGFMGLRFDVLFPGGRRILLQRRRRIATFLSSLQHIW